MKQQYQDVITEHLGVKPIMINSALVSAQNRVRLYWTNIPNITQPQDKGLILKDILEYNQSSVSELSDAKKDRILNSKRGKGFFYSPNTHDKIGTLVAGYHKEPTDGSYLEVPKPLKDTERNRRHCKEENKKSLCMTSTMYKGAGNNGMTLVPIKNPERIKERTTYYQFDVSGKGYNSQQDRVRKLDKPSGTLAAQAASIPKILACLTERRTEDAKKIRKEHREKTGKDFSPRRAKELIPRTDNKVNCLTTSMTKEHIIQIPRKKSKTIRTGGRGSYDRHEWDSVGNKGTELYYRKLTPTECERLQTVPDGYTEGVSNTQRYKMLGNGWTVEVIKHIFSEVR